MLQNPEPMPFKTFGSAIDAVRDVCMEAAKRAHQDHYSTPVYFTKRAEYVHTAFDAYCAGIGLSPKASAQLRTQLASHFAYYRHGTEALRVLFTEIPMTHLVRGQWVSARANVAIH
jgi:hypothetical protein